MDLLAAFSCHGNHRAVGRLEDDVIVHSHDINILSHVPVAGVEQQTRGQDPAGEEGRKGFDVMTE